MKYNIEGYYDILLNEKKELMISVKSKPENPENSVILYDGGTHAIFYRRHDETILLDYIHPEARNILFSTPTVLIAEINDNTAYSVEKAYDVPVKKVKKLPLTEKFPNLPPKYLEACR